MKLVHLADLHIGKRVNEVSMLEEQKFIFQQIYGIIEKENPDGIIIAGDVYDKSIPSADSMMLFSDCLDRLSRFGKPVFVISGNHDSAERISYMNSILKKDQIYMSDVYSGKVDPVVLQDDYGPVHIYLLPFVKPAVVRHFLAEEEKGEVNDYDQAIRKAIEKMEVAPGIRNVLVTHQFITDALRSESEDFMVGGLGNVDVSAFDAFDYVALGHLHRPQFCGRPEVRYCGSPLKYSFSEVEDEKSVTIVELGEKHRVDIRLVPLKPLHDWQEIRGTYEEVTARDFYLEKNCQEDFVRVTLTDEEDVPDAMAKLKTIYHNIMELRYDNKRTRAGIATIGGAENVEKKTPKELFAELYKLQNDREMSREQKLFLDSVVERIVGKEEER